MRKTEEYLEDANGFFYTEDFVYHKESVLKIINEARKETSIEFFKWCEDELHKFYNHYIGAATDDDLPEAEFLKFTKLTPEERYSLFIKSIEDEAKGK